MDGATVEVALLPDENRYEPQSIRNVIIFTSNECLIYFQK